MIVNAVYHGREQVHRIYHGGNIIFERGPVEFHAIDGDKLIIVGAYSARAFSDGLYLDCAPEWVFPVQNGGTLRLTQVFGATKNGNKLEVK